MATPAELLRSWLESLDVEGFSLAIPDDELAEARADVPELALVSDEALRNVLGAAACNGVTRLLAGAELHLDLEGPGPDPMREALEGTFSAIREAHGLLLQPGRSSHVAGLDLLASIIAAYEAHLAPPSPSPM